MNLGRALPAAALAAMAALSVPSGHALADPILVRVADVRCVIDNSENFLRGDRDPVLIIFSQCEDAARPEVGADQRLPQLPVAAAGAPAPDGGFVAAQSRAYLLGSAGCRAGVVRGVSASGWRGGGGVA